MLHHPYTHKRKSQLLGTDHLDSGWGYNLNLPVREFAHMLDHPERLTRAELKRKSWEANNTINGLEMLDGLLKIDAVEDGMFDAYLGAGLFEFSELVKGKTLQDLDLGGERTWVKKAEWKYPTDDFAIFPVNNEAWYGYNEDGSPANADYIANCGGNQNHFVNGELHTADSYFVVTPFPFVGYILKQIFKFANFNITINEFESNSALVKKCLYSNNSIVQIKFNNSAGIWVGVTRSIDKWDMRKVVQPTNIIDFLIDLQNDLNIVFVFDRNREVRILDREKQMNLPASTLLLPYIIKEAPAGKFDKDELGVELKQEFDSADEFFTEKWNWHEITDDDDVRDPVATVDDLPSPGEAEEIHLVTSENVYYKWSELENKDQDGNVINKYWDWAQYSRNQQNMQIGEEDYEKIESGFSLTNINNAIFTRGNNPIWWTIAEKYECKPKLLNYYGIINGNPYGDGGGSVAYDGISNDLRMGENPKYEKRWASTVQFFIDRQKVPIKLLIPQRIYRDLDLAIPYLHPEGFKFFIEEATANQEEGVHLQDVEIEAWAY